MAHAPLKASDDCKLEILHKHSAFIFDLDGTIWKGTQLIPGASEVLNLLRYQGKRIFFVTNNSTLSRKAFLQKCIGLGLKVNIDEIYNSAYAAAAYLKTKNFQKKVYVIGERGIIEEMHSVGLEAVGGPDDADAKVDYSKGDPYMEVDEEVGAVVVGWDRNINYYKLQYGLTCLLENQDCLFIATNTDARSPLSTNQEWVGGGAMVGALIGASELDPIVVGKPASFLLDVICRTSGLSCSQICVVGDRLDTDILWGNKNGCGTLLVLSGVTSEASMLDSDNKIYPSYFIDSIGDLLSVKEKLSYCTVS
ncbi:hypothetical protein CEUSTIGMA_g9754.t1 [Chlamydomonas eustigma]|uniref:Phosphoglycolate phosphatase n=1 Tax=Chlamydomonas eustigma TaxID=1157962 RepID=A0A250XGW4_9CHLO|nr:hypothetical protein CEUSTIGMA_g9754.t1 [Chlamydomonas eustigma]|eukprot:GAX82325.1 hypothetical protein CEUSTIGMA_g9754.t1 [Chlamydomonas eustigma]